MSQVQVLTGATLFFTFFSLFSYYIYAYTEIFITFTPTLEKHPASAIVHKH